MGKSFAKWLPLYRVEQILTNSSNNVRKVGTNYQQCVHRIRLTPVNPQYQIEDLAKFHQNNFVPGLSTSITSEPSLFDSTLPELLTDKFFTPTDETTDSQSVLFYYNPRLVAPPAATATPRLVRQPPVAPPLIHALPQDDFNELPVNFNFILDDVAWDSSSSDDNAQYCSSNDNNICFYSFTSNSTAVWPFV